MAELFTEGNGYNIGDSQVPKVAGRTIVSSSWPTRPIAATWSSWLPAGSISSSAWKYDLISDQTAQSDKPCACSAKAAGDSSVESPIYRDMIHVVARQADIAKQRR